MQSPLTIIALHCDSSSLIQLRYALKWLNNKGSEQDICSDLKFNFFNEQFEMIKDRIDHTQWKITMRTYKQEMQTIFDNCHNAKKAVDLYHNYTEAGTWQKCIEDCKHYHPENALSGIKTRARGFFEDVMQAVRYSDPLYYAMSEEYMKNSVMCLNVAHLCINYTLSSLSINPLKKSYDLVNEDFRQIAKTFIDVQSSMRKNFKDIARDDLKTLLKSLQTEHSYYVSYS